jgi:hypothetical protein
MKKWKKPQQKNIKESKMEDKFFIEAKIEVQEETAEMRKTVASVIDLPKSGEKQPDLLYFTALFVSAGTNLNGAHFLPSELVKAEDTIVSKALDVEHKEEEIIGHIYDRAFINKEGAKLELAELENKESGSLDAENKDMHILIAGVIYKNRFPNLAKEVSEGEWKVSMECYFSNYDVKVGDTILKRPEAEAMGLANDDSLFGKMAKVVRKGKEIAKGKLERVLRDIVFSGCGVVKNPANPPSVILETAKEKPRPAQDPKEVIILDYDKLEEENASNKLTSNEVEGDTSVITDGSDNQEDSFLQYNDTIGICVAYKKRVFSGEPQGPDTKVIHEDWCSLYDQSCTSFSRDTSDPKCLRNQANEVARTYAKKLLQKREEGDRRVELTANLETMLKRFKKLD